MDSLVPRLYLGTHCGEALPREPRGRWGRLAREAEPQAPLRCQLFLFNTSRHRWACPSGAVILHYEAADAALARPHRACPGGAMILHYEETCGAFRWRICPDKTIQAGRNNRGSMYEPPSAVVQNQRSTGASPAGAGALLSRLESTATRMNLG